MMTTAIDVGLLFVRVTIGITLAAHGYAKIFQGGRLAGTARWFDSIGMRPGRVHAPLAAFTEIGAGVLFALGLLTPLAAAAMVALMVVAAWTVHRNSGFFIVGNGWEYNFVIACVAVGVALTGAGNLSVDNLVGLGSTAGQWWGVAIALFVGLGAGVAQLVLFFRPPTPAD